MKEQDMPRRDLVDIRGGTVSEWTAAGSVLAENEVAVVWEDDGSRHTVVVGDGVQTAAALYATASGTYLAPTDLPVLHLPGATSDYVSTPDHADLRITGDIDLRVIARFDNWASHANNQFVLGRFVNERCYALYIGQSGQIVLRWSTDGTSGGETVVTGPTASFSAGQRGGVRATLDVDNGSGAYEVKFYESSDEGATWTQVGSTTTGGATTSIVAGTSALEVGRAALFAGSTPVNGDIVRAQVYDGIGGTLVADLRCDRGAVGPRFRDSTGKLWTFNGSGWSWVGPTVA